MQMESQAIEFGSLIDKKICSTEQKLGYVGKKLTIAVRHFATSSPFRLFSPNYLRTSSKASNGRAPKLFFRRCILPSLLKVPDTQSYSLQHRCSYGLCSVCMVAAPYLSDLEIQQIHRAQRNRITKAEFCLYVNFLSQEFHRVFGAACTAVATSILLHAFRLLCKVFAIEYFHTRKQRYSVSAACLMLSLNVSLDEHRMTYSTLANYSSVACCNRMSPKYLVVI